MDETFAALAGVHGGIFTRAQALAAGVSDRELHEAVRAQSLRRLRHGCYAPWGLYESLDEVGRHLLLCRAALACQQGQVALTGASAAAVHGLALYQQDLQVVHLVRLDRGSSRQQVGIVHHRVCHDIARDLQLVDGFQVVSPARAVWELASASTLESAVCAADSALGRWPDLRGELMTIGGSFSRRPGSRTARLAVQLADGRAASVGESLSRVLFYRHALPRPELQHEVRTEDGQLVAVTDFYWADHCHVGEFDGKVKYGELLREGETPADAVFREKRREDAVRATGRGMTRWTWVDLTPSGAPALLRRLRADLDRSRTLYRRPAA
jgi:hypothetical protein